MIEHCYTRKSINKLVLDCCKIVVIRKSNKLPSWSNHGSSKIDRLERRWKLVQPRWKEEMEACGGHGWLHPLRQTQPLHSPSALAGMLPLRRALITASTVLLIHTRKKSEHETEKINSISRANLERRHFLYKKRSDQRKSQDCLHYIVNGFAFSMEWYRPRGKAVIFMLLASSNAKLAAQSLQEFLLLLAFTPWAVGASRWSMLLSHLAPLCY